MRFTPGRATGILDKVVGLNKEIVGELFGRAELKRSGQLQQEKGTAKLSALQAEAEAKAQDSKAKTLDKAQKKVDDKA